MGFNTLYENKDYTGDLLMDLTYLIKSGRLDDVSNTNIERTIVDYLVDLTNKFFKGKDSFVRTQGFFNSGMSLALDEILDMFNLLYILDKNYEFDSYEWEFTFNMMIFDLLDNIQGHPLDYSKFTDLSYTIERQVDLNLSDFTLDRINEFIIRDDTLTLLFDYKSDDLDIPNNLSNLELYQIMLLYKKKDYYIKFIESI